MGGGRGGHVRAGIGAAAIAATYVSAIVGAGFASGQEVLRFFTHFGAWGLAGLGVASVLLALCGTAIMVESRWSRARSHGDLLWWLGGAWFARLYDFLITLFLFGTTAVMVAGSGAFFQEQLGLPSFPGDLVMAVAAAATVLAGLRGVVVASEVVVPFLLLSVTGIALLSLADAAGPARSGLTVPGLTWYHPEAAAAPSWLLGACLYVSYNLVLSPAVLTPLAAQARSNRAIVAGGLVGGLLLGAAATCVDVALLAGLPESATFEVPMLHAAGRLAGLAGRLLRPACAVVIWAEIYTTAVGLLYGFAVRLGGGVSPRGRRGGEGTAFRHWVLAGGLGALVLARAGFSNMVATLYPAVGYAGLAFIALVLWRLGGGGGHAARRRGGERRPRKARPSSPGGGP